jgi:hypothetical protein
MEVRGELETSAVLPPDTRQEAVWVLVILDALEEIIPSTCRELHPDIAVMQPVAWSLYRVSSLDYRSNHETEEITSGTWVMWVGR